MGVPRELGCELVGHPQCCIFFQEKDRIRGADYSELKRLSKNQSSQKSICRVPSGPLARVCSQPPPHIPDPLADPPPEYHSVAFPPPTPQTPSYFNSAAPPPPPPLVPIVVSQPPPLLAPLFRARSLILSSFFPFSPTFGLPIPPPT